MQMVFPGTQIEAKNTSGKAFLEGLFIAGSIMLGQITELTGIKAPTLQNWVNRGFLSHPEGKKYNKNQLARILIINSLRKVLKLEDIGNLLIYVNGDPEDIKDDIIDESQLYSYLCEVVLSDDFSLHTLNNRVIHVLSNYNERIRGAKKRLAFALETICKSYLASQLLSEAELNLENI